MLAGFEGQRFDVVLFLYIFVGYSTRVKFNSEMQAFLTGLLCFTKIFVYKVRRNLMGLTSPQRKHGRRS